MSDFRAQPAVVGAHTRIDGHVDASGDLVLAGTIVGNVRANARLHVLDGATLTGDVVAASVQIDGTVIGNVTTTGSVYVSATGSLVGDVAQGRLRLDDGGRMVGIVGAAREAGTQADAPAPPARPTVDVATALSSTPADPTPVADTLDRGEQDVAAAHRWDAVETTWQVENDAASDGDTHAAANIDATSGAVVESASISDDATDEDDNEDLTDASPTVPIPPQGHRPLGGNHGKRRR